MNESGRSEYRGSLGRTRNGSVLVLSIIILTFMLVVALSFLSSAILQQRSSLSTGNSVKAFQNADSAVEMVLYQIYKASPTPTTINSIVSNIRTITGDTSVTCASGVIGSTAKGWTVTFFKGNEGELAMSCTESSLRTTVSVIRAQGSVGGTSRAVEVSVRTQ